MKDGEGGGGKGEAGLATRSEWKSCYYPNWLKWALLFGGERYATDRFI